MQNNTPLHTYFPQRGKKLRSPQSIFFNRAKSRFPPLADGTVLQRSGSARISRKAPQDSIWYSGTRSLDIFEQDGLDFTFGFLVIDFRFDKGGKGVGDGTRHLVRG